MGIWEQLESKCTCCRYRKCRLKKTVGSIVHGVRESKGYVAYQCNSQQSTLSLPSQDYPLSIMFQYTMARWRLWNLLCTALWGVFWFILVNLQSFQDLTFLICKPQGIYLRVEPKLHPQLLQVHISVFLLCFSKLAPLIIFRLVQKLGFKWNTKYFTEKCRPAHITVQLDSPCIMNY